MRSSAASRALVVMLLSTAAAACKDPAPAPTPEPLPLASVAQTTPTATAVVAVSSASAVAPSAAPSAPPAPFTDARAALVWQASGKAAWKTVWVEPSAAGAGVVVKRERAEPVIATRRALFALRITTGATATLDAEPLGGGAGILLGSATVESCPPTGEEASVGIVGAVGSLVFSYAHGWVQACGAAHPMWSDSSGVDDLDRNAPLALSPFPGLPRLTVIAGGKFTAAFGDEGGGCLMDPKARPDLYTASFAYDGRGVLRGHYLFTKESNYMCGAGPGHYRTTQEVDDSALPDSLAFWKEAPKWLVPYLAKHPSLGVSPLPVELDPVAAATAFETDPVPRPPRAP